MTMPNVSMLPFRKAPIESNLSDWGALTCVTMLLHPLGFGGIYMLIFWVCLGHLVPPLMPHGATNLTYLKMLAICGAPRWLVFWAPYFYIPHGLVEAVRLTVLATIVIAVIHIHMTTTPGAIT